MTDEQRETRTVRAAEKFAAIFPGRDFRTAKAAPADQEPTAAETARFHRDRAERYHLAHTPHLFAQSLADHSQVQDWAAHYLRNMIGAPSLLLAGDVGTGKTHQAYGALRYLATSGWPVIAWRGKTAAALYASLRPGTCDDFEAAITGWSTAPLVLLDDLGAARLTGFTEEVTYRLVDDRYAAGLPMIVTTNVKPREFSKEFGDRIASRLKQMCQVIDLGTEDRRRAPEAAA